MKTYKKEIIIYVLTIIIITAIKSPFIYDESNSFYEFFHSVYIMYGEHVIFNVIWLMPVLMTIFFGSKNCYLRLLNFNLRYRNRNIAFYHTIISFYQMMILLSLLSIIIPLPLLVLKTNNNLVFDLTIISFIIKYVIEIQTISLIIILIEIILKNYTYNFTIITAIIIIALSGYKNSLLPLISLYIDNHLNLVSIAISAICLFIIYHLYTTRDILGGQSK